MQSTGTRALRAGPDSTIEVSSDTLIVFPDRYRQALTTPAGVATTTVRGPRGYLRIGDVHTALDAAQFKALTEALGRNPVALLKSYCAGTLAATVAGLGEHEGKPVTGLALADGSEIAIDSATGFILRVRYGGVSWARRERTPSPTMPIGRRRVDSSIRTTRWRRSTGRSRTRPAWKRSWSIPHSRTATS